MSLRGLLDAGYALLVDELRATGMSLTQAVDKVNDMLTPRTPEELAAIRQREQARQEQAVMARYLGAMNLTAIPKPKREATT